MTKRESQKQKLAAFQAADNAWSAALQATFGRRAGDARYTKEGQSTSELARLHAEFRRTGDAWRHGM